ncbi:phage tail protein [Salmonella enterica]|uniref:Phage tail protein n=2 Tax=Salmonella enterica subsp. enterica serovar Stanley TaxID=192953 RepID=A0A5X4QNF7_SALET|nr:MULTISPECIES: phage tail protein [unclassified Salmonella]EAT8317073.1 phage tail protein [Salmonella enterica]EBG7046368.1 phage tail protein [Salmonella enterica subsp. enterica serovar Stanley]EBS3741163.1 phage tail protein [Salmonella enterica subsp. enterica serovar Saintpaul]EBV2043919.1 phage tail protein [Salmonella enterica subsp. enterica serovar Java]EDV6348083.1 phage tail protein [Salmonella enterica subsp. enterica]EEE3907466.1 phage tail protein [Salmonella enterica subsp. 
MADYYSIITNRGKELEAEALASGRLIVLTHFVVGDSNGRQVKPDPAQIRLINETYRGGIAELVVSPEQSTQLMAKIVLPTGIGGFTVREVGLMTDAGELYAVANCPSIDKPVGGVSVNMQFRLAVSDTSNITLNVATGDGLFLRIDQNLKEIKVRGAEAQKTSRESIGVLDSTTQQRGLVQLSSSVNSTSETQAATPAAVKIAMDNANARLAKERNGADIPNVPLFLQNLGLVDVLFKGDGRFLAGTFVSDAIDRTSIGARAATGCQFMRAHQAPDAPDQVSYWQVITLTEVVSPTSVVDVLAISGNNVVFGHGTGAGITSWRNVAMLEGAAFTGDISASNVRGGNSVTIGDGTGGLATGGVDGAGFNGNNMNVKSWDGIGFQNAADLVIRAYISTKLGIIAASESVYAGSANLYKNGDVYGDKWSTGNGPNWLSLFLEHLDSQIRNDLTTWTTNNFPTKSDVSAALSLKPGRQYITQIGVYQNDKSKPFMLHDDDSGIFLAPSSSVHLDANGWHRDASTGLITQWGSGNVAGGQQQRVNFPMTFPNTCVTVVANDIGSGTLALSTISKDIGGFTVKGSSTIFGFNWLSMGY